MSLDTKGSFRCTTHVPHRAASYQSLIRDSDIQVIHGEKAILRPFPCCIIKHLSVRSPSFCLIAKYGLVAMGLPSINADNRRPSDVLAVDIGPSFRHVPL